MVAAFLFASFLLGKIIALILRRIPVRKVGKPAGEAEVAETEESAEETEEAEDTETADTDTADAETADADTKSETGAFATAFVLYLVLVVVGVTLVVV